MKTKKKCPKEQTLSQVVPSTKKNVNFFFKKVLQVRLIKKEGPQQNSNLISLPIIIIGLQFHDFIH